MESATITVSEAGGGEIPVVTPKTFIDGKASQLFYCSSVEGSKGAVPGKATFRFISENTTGATDRYTTAPSTLGIYQTYWDEQQIGHGSRALCVVDGCPIFAGNFLVRNDAGQSDVTMWTALDDRQLLSNIPIRGCVVRDTDGLSQSLAARFLCRVNPNGYWNSVGHTFVSNNTDHPLHGKVVPVFAPYAQRRKVYDSPDDVFPQALVDGDVCPWTPRRLLQYLYFLSTLGFTGTTPDCNGMIKAHWRSLADSTRLEINGDQIASLRGVEAAVDTESPASTVIDPLDRKMPDMQFQGKTMLAALADTLKVAGTHDIVTELRWKQLGGEINGDPSAAATSLGQSSVVVSCPTAGESFILKRGDIIRFSGHATDYTITGDVSCEESESASVAFSPVLTSGVSLGETISFSPNNAPRIDYTSVKSVLGFVPELLTGQEDTTNPKSIIQAIQDGKASNSPTTNTAYDFQLQEDSSVTKESVLVEGSPVRVETSLSTLTSGGLKPAWTDTERDDFLAVIDGNADGYAVYRANQLNPYESASAWSAADGGGGRPKVFARTAEAVAFARSMYPKVFKAFYVEWTDTVVIDALKGIEIDGTRKYDDTTSYPQVKHFRQVLPEQLQYWISTVNTGDVDENQWMTSRYPIRAELDQSDAGDGSEWGDVGFVSLRMTGDGILWVDMAESRDADLTCIYSGSLIGESGQCDPTSVTAKPLRLNIAFPMDHRVIGYSEKMAGSAVYVSDFRIDTGGYTMQYIDSPDGYDEAHQVNSSPTANANFYSGTTSGATTSGPLNRYLPPGTEEDNAQYAAERRLATLRHIRRRSSWKLLGIRPEYRAGDWVSYVHIVGYDASGNQYNLGGGSTVDYSRYDIQAPIATVTYDFDNQVTTVGGLISEVSNNAAVR